jgi:hypothetical protein|tara:strand:- start:166 stop:540 length:375 start_codon:yes stop_codon:yes gene_type:complete
MSDKKIITFIDNAGRNILGVVSSEDDSNVKVENPVMITVQQQQNGQMAVQLFPLFFQEFVEEGENKRSNYFNYKKCSIAIGEDFAIEPRIIDQYDKIVNPTLQPVPTQAASNEQPEVIKLFDDE